MLRLFLPPNLAAAAPRNAIAVKVELELSQTPDAGLLPALALLQRWCGTPQPPAFLQLTRAQLRELAGTLQGRPVFFWINQPAAPLLWIGPVLRGVSDYLEDPPNTPAAEIPGIHATRLGLPISKPKTENPKLKTATTSSTLTVDGSEHFLAVTLPSREHVAYGAALDLLKANGFVLEPSNRKWWLRDRHKALNFLAANAERLRTEFFAEFTPNFEKNTERLGTTEIVCEAVEGDEGFDVTVGLRAGDVSEDTLWAAAATNRGYVESGGKVYLIDPTQIARVAATRRALAGDLAPATGKSRRTHRITTAGLAEAEVLLTELSPHFQPPAAWSRRSEALRHLSKLQPAPLPANLDAQLRPYQRLGVAWLWHLHRLKLGGILADEMGLGKTLQALALLSALRATREKASADRRSQAPNAKPETAGRGLTLVVCPASLVENWRREAARFVPELRVFIHHGAQRIGDSSGVPDCDLIVTSYGTLARDRERLAEIDFDCVLADEAQHAKNRRTQNAQALRSLHANARFLLTGTPLENSLDDLRSLFEILMPGYIDAVPAGTRGDERAWHDERLRAKTAPYILRRTKRAVAPELPAKIEQVIYCALSSSQAALYRGVQEQSERALLDLEASGASENSLRLATLTQLLRLRQVCCDPRLLPNTPPEAASSVDSAKLEAFREVLSEALDDGHRLLVFSQFTSLLALLRQELEGQGVAHCYLDGSMSPKARQAEVDRFNGGKEVAVFLISLKAGGTGLNLTGADTVVHFDPWWNPAVEAQATDRAHRIGQTRVVTSYKLICSGTVEEKVLHLQASKRALLADVFDASDAASARLSLTDLKSLLAG